MSRYWLFKGTKLVLGPNENAAQAGNYLDELRPAQWQPYLLVCFGKSPQNKLKEHWLFFNRDYSEGWNQVYADDKRIEAIKMVLFLSGESL